jgi:4-diphosphocytidyl-2-C-methyl-D-erythritol kinase
MPGVAVQALAKVNLGLRVLYRRPDGYHELRTVFQTISLADRIEVRYRRAGERRVELTCSRAELEGADNLAARAAARLLEATGSGGEVHIHLEKRIPIGAGLGGGSSDAAAALCALASMLRPQPERRLLLRLAGELGSDVPFFLLGGRALGLGRGSELYPLPDGPQRWVLVVAPPFAVSTAEAYRRLNPDLTSGGRDDKIDRFSSDICASEQGLEAEWTAGAENDFEDVVCPRSSR